MEMLVLNNPSRPRARLGDRRTREPRHVLLQVLAGTGAQQRALVDRAPEPCSEWLSGAWNAARASTRETEHQALPERALANLNTSEGAVARADLQFLRKCALEDERPSWEAVASIRLLASLAEDQMAPKELLIEPLLAALDLDDPRRRFAAAEGLWQCDATAAIPSLEALLAKESHPQIRATAEHALRVLRGLKDGDV